MGNIFTKFSFEQAVASLTNHSMVFSDVLTESRDYSNAGPLQKTIFLSHSHLDAKYVNMARTFFESLGVYIYVDWADKTMPQSPCGTTALKIKEKIKQNNKFVLLATNNAISSKWCNWEVGIGDTYKYYKDDIAILPLAATSSTWNGNEYLQIYPYISGPDSSIWDYTPSKYSVHYPDGRNMSLVSWLSK